MKRSFFSDETIPKSVRCSSLIPAQAYNAEDELYLTDDKSLGFAFLCEPINGVNDTLFEEVKSFLNGDYPADFLMQFCLFRSPDIYKQISQIFNIRKHFYDKDMNEVIKKRADFLLSNTTKPISKRISSRISDVKLIVSCKMPIANNQPTEDDLVRCAELKNKIYSSLDAIKLYPININPDIYIRLLETMMNWEENAGWREFESTRMQWDEETPISEQVFDYGKEVGVFKDHIKIGDTYTRTLSVKTFPKTLRFGDATAYSGDWIAGSDSKSAVSNNYMVVCNMFFPKSDKEKSKVERKRTFTVRQAYGPLLKFVPVLADKHHDLDLMYKSMSRNSSNPIRISMTQVLFAKSLKELDEITSKSDKYWHSKGFNLKADVHINLPVLLNALPLGADRYAVRDLFRYKTMTSEHASVIVPLFSEWKGTGTPHVSLISRNGQLMSFSLHDSNSNKNAIIAAESGSGKSFFVNELILSYLSEGAQVWVIDVGRSYEKLVNTLGGSFLHFGASSDACINPFPMVESLVGNKETEDEGEEDAIIGILQAMAAPNEKLSDLQTSQLKKHLHDVWAIHDRNTLIDHIAESLLTDKDQRVRDVGTQLYAFTSKGAYGRYFNRDNNVDLNGSFTVLELEELKGKKDLQKVVLLQLIYQIQQEVYLGDRDRKKIVIIDEAWDLLRHGDTAVFMEHAYRRFRKYGASAAIATQSISDLDSTKGSAGRAIAANSAITCLLMQNPESISEVKESKRLVMSEPAFRLLESVRTLSGEYSEIFIKMKESLGVGRLIVNDFQKLLYSTHPDDVNAIKNLTDQGLSVNEAISKLLESGYLS
ncbi:type-IV secretion system protein TraC [Piscirickettsia litoralis]|uniref:Type-IV secretion system protein TraC n=1 Tax=Piscirickettsia litoralis TaxID=1891921 RepID=A0ABX3A1D4_9GAMM|nr:type-IV secretion system protein TraC [Piscirickettsia litoralis]